MITRNNINWSFYTIAVLREPFRFFAQSSSKRFSDESNGIYSLRNFEQILIFGADQSRWGNKYNFFQGKFKEKNCAVEGD